MQHVLERQSTASGLRSQCQVAVSPSTTTGALLRDGHGFDQLETAHNLGAPSGVTSLVAPESGQIESNMPPSTAQVSRELRISTAEISAIPIVYWNWSTGARAPAGAEACATRCAALHIS